MGANVFNRDLIKSSLGKSIFYFTGLRIWTIILMLVFSWILPHTFIPEDPFYRDNLESIKNSEGAYQILFMPWYRWDTGHYIQIAENGYSIENPEKSVWPPLYPFLIWALSQVIHPNVLSALLISNSFLILAFALLYLFTVRNYSIEIADRTLALYVTFPTAFFLVAGYTEPIFLCLVLGFFISMHSSKWLLAGILASLAALTRLQGVFLILVMLWQLFCSREKILSSPRKIPLVLLGILLPAGSLATFFFFIHFSLNLPWPWQTLGNTWNQHTGFPWEGIWGNFSALFLGRPVSLYTSPISLALDLLLAILSVIILVVSFRNMPVDQFIYACIMLIPALVKVDNTHILVSFSRYFIVIFPFFLFLAQRLKSRTGLFAIYCIGLVSQVVLLFMFYSWIWVA
jgi:hypothetical protein